MMEANEYQIGGKHYQGNYQHWDFVCDVQLHYLLGCATKYISRFRNKNGIEDLRKSLHYISKAREKGIYPNRYLGCTISRRKIEAAWIRFSESHQVPESGILMLIFQGEYDEATRIIDSLIFSMEEPEVPKNYIDPDNNYYKG